MITEDEYGPNFVIFVLPLRENPGKNRNQKIDPTGDRTRARCVRSNDVTPRTQRWPPVCWNTDGYEKMLYQHNAYF